MRWPIAAIALCITGGGCTSSTFTRSRLVEVECVVESFDPAAMVFYDFGMCGGIADTRLSRVRVVSPVGLRDRVFAIDLGDNADGTSSDCSELTRVRTKVHLSIPLGCVDSKPAELIPISAVELKGR